MKVFKLLEDCKGQQFVQTQNAISNTKISSLQITRFRENRLYSGHRDIYILLFQRKNFLYEYMKIHHSCPALSFKAPVSVHSWNNAHTHACKHRLCITVLYISQHRGGKGACTWWNRHNRQDTTTRCHVHTNELMTQDWYSVTSALLFFYFRWV